METKTRNLWLPTLLGLLTFVGFMSVWYFMVIDVSDSDANVKSGVEILREENKQILNHIQESIDSGYVVIVATLDSNSCIGFQDVAGNNLRPYTYYYWVVGRLIEKRFSSAPIITNTKADFLMRYRSVDGPVPVKKTPMDAMSHALKMRLYDVRVAPSQIWVR